MQVKHPTQPILANASTLLAVTRLVVPDLDEPMSTATHLIVPDLDEPVVHSGDEVGLVSAMVVVDAVDSLFMSLQRKVRCVGAELPYLGGVAQ